MNLYISKKLNAEFKNIREVVKFIQQLVQKDKLDNEAAQKPESIHIKNYRENFCS